MRVAIALGVLVVAACSAPPASVATGTPAATAAPATAPAATRASPTPTPSPTPVPKVPVLSDAPVQSGLRAPWDLAFAPDGRMFVTERVGNVLVFESGQPNARRLGHYSLPNVRQMGESGLMGIALDPDFARNGLVYVCASRIEQGAFVNQIVRLRASGNEIALDTVILPSGMRAAAAHDGCALRFGADGKLWASMGDATISRLAQDTSSLNGKILRMNADGSVPADNPVLPGRSGPSLVWSYGHRNVQGLAFQPGTGAIFAIEHGADAHDEINVIEKGANYGWPLAEGPDPHGRFTDAVWTSGDRTPTIAHSGGTFVVGPAWGLWSGSLFTAQLKESDLRRYAVDGTKVTAAEILLDRRYGRLRTPVLGPDGALYITTSNGTGDRIVRVVATQPG